MSASATIQTQRGQYAILQAELPSHGLINLGILLLAFLLVGVGVLVSHH